MPVSFGRRSKNRFVLSITIILALAFLGLSTANYLLTKESVRREIILNDLPLTRDNIYSELTGELMRPILVASSMSTDTFLKDWAKGGEKDTTKITRYLQGIRKRYGFFSTFFVSAETGKYYHFKGLHKTITREDDHDDWYYTFVESGLDYRVEVDSDEAAGYELTIFINYRLEDEQGELLGVTGVGLKLMSVAELIKSYQVKYDRTIYLVDQAGVIQVHPELNLAGKRTIHGIDGMAPMAEEMLVPRKEPANYEFTEGGHHMLLTVRYMPQLHWYIFVEQDEDKALENARMNFLRSVLIGLAASTIIIWLTLKAVNTYQLKLEEAVVTDELTGAANRRRLEDEFSRALASRQRHGRRFCLILMDLDGFKRVNDELGHLAGDKVLIRVTSVVSQLIRSTDLFARWGGDEFLVLAECGDDEGMQLAERIRRDVQSCDLTDGQASEDDPRSAITICCGVTPYRDGDDLDSMVLRADKALYRCKAEGGNGVIRA